MVKYGNQDTSTKMVLYSFLLKMPLAADILSSLGLEGDFPFCGSFFVCFFSTFGVCDSDGCHDWMH